MKIRLVQNIIDLIRRKKYDEKYSIMRETYAFLSKYIDVPEEVHKIFKTKYRFPQIHYKTDRKAFRKFLDSIDASHLPKADGALRKHQLRILEVIKEVFPELEKRGIEYFLIGGTLLGAVRHKGFIPWDEDFDVDLMRTDYNKFIEFVKDNYIYISEDRFTNYDDFYDYLNVVITENPNQIIFANKTHGVCAYKGTSLVDTVQLDFFPRDYVRDDLKEKDYLDYRYSCDKVLKNLNSWTDIFKFFNDEINNEKIYTKKSSMTAKSWGSYAFYNRYRTLYEPTDVIFPLKKVEFEDTSLYVPNKSDVFLKNIFKNYNSIPMDINLGIHVKIYNNHLKRHNKKFYIQIEDFVDKSKLQEKG